MNNDQFDDDVRSRVTRIEEQIVSLRSAWPHHDKVHDARDRYQEKVDAELNDVRHRFIPREAYEARIREIMGRIDGVGKLLTGVIVALALAILAAFVNAVIVIAEQSQ